ncbi:chemotaxis protein CheA [Novosphingobium sp. JCM 18896]|uniref:chemotaxis protein CheA n=1 Tax=Novosphingobium sp. JCM 18896 TaxID=2989731 RepID=UPI00222361DF|nr:chemotaxis protein CheA [Novosphingobium sp. JCM 18896]MCW1427774.1 chemotaxis protein CheA [Novosphingobium sp. JCM 18896]
MSSNDPVAAFLVEAGDLLDQVEQDLLDLGKNLQDADLINAVFRGLHTLKGSGAMFGFEALAAFTHHCESAFDRVRKGKAAATAELVGAILAAKDHMAVLLDPAAPKGDAAGEAILDRLRAAMDDETAEPAAAAPVAAAPAKPAATGWHLRFYLPGEAMVNGLNPLGLIDELRELGDARVAVLRDRLPPLDQFDPTQCYFGWDVTLRGDVSRDDIDDVFMFVIDDMELQLEPLVAEVEAPAVEANPIVEAATAPAASAVPAPPSSSAAAPASPAPAVAKERPAENVRVPAERLDELMDRVGELVIAQSRLSQIAQDSSNAALRSVTEDIERLSSELRDTMMVLRMVPVSTLFGRFRRLVHDLANETGKTIELITEGESTELDKTVIERLADPMIHLIRNSCDHGLETAEDRLAAGKLAAGILRLRAQQSGGEVIISIQDDGKGLDRDRIRAKAEGNGLIQPGQVLSDQELYQLIFQPGFSTAAAVTNLSGRGVGMDVVKRTIESLRGTIDIASTPGKGSTISLRIPLTLAIIEGLLVRVGEGHYVIPLAAVEECIELSLEEDLRSRGRSFITLRDRLVPFLRLREMFATGTKPDVFQKIVVISTGNGERVGLVVDQIVGSYQTVIKSMSTLHRDVSTFSGATILGDGSVALILDIAQLVSIGQQQEERLRAAG